VSSVGAYWPLSHKGDEPVDVGYERRYETMVFRIDESGKTQWCEVECKGANDPDECEANHEAMVAKYSKRY
jgi:hypothetical protein